MKVLHTLLFLFFLFSSFDLFAQKPCLEIDMVAINGSKGEEICIAVKVRNFDSLVAIQFAVEYDPFVLQATSIKYVYGSLVGLSVANINIDTVQKLVKFVWSTGNVNSGEKMPNDSTLFIIGFKLIGEPGSCSPIRLAPDRRYQKEVIDPKDDFVCLLDPDPLDQVKVQVPVDLCVFAYNCGTQGNNGNITIKPYGGRAPYTLEFNAMVDILNQSGDVKVYNNLSAGTYTIRVIDASGKDTIITVTILPTSTIRIIPDLQAIKNPTCWNDSNGVLKISITGGKRPYIVAWQPLNIFGDTLINRLPVGDYTVIVRDSVGCEITESFRLFADTLFTDLVIEKEESCSGGNDGVIKICARGGSPFVNGEYRFSWSQKGFIEMDTCSRFTMGTDSGFVIIEDRRMCKNIEFFKFNPVANMFDSVIIDSVKCFGEANGSLSVYMKSKTSLNTPFAFLLYDSLGNVILGGGNGPDFYNSPGLKAGQYRIEAIDNAGCTFLDTFLILQPDSFYIITNQVDTSESCLPGRDGFIDISAFGGNLPPRYQWSAPGGMSNRIANLSAGTYTVTVTDQKACEIQEIFTINPPTPPIISGITITPIICPNDKNGCVEVMYNLGSSPLKNISWNIPNGNTARVCGLGAGLYSVTITDQNNCTAIDTASIRADSAGLTLDSFAIRPVKCFNDNQGLIILFPQGGVRPYGYNWSNGNQGQINPDLSSGSYCVTITDAGGCPSFDTCFVLTNPPKITVAVSNIISPSCASLTLCDGQARATVNGPDLPFSLEFSSGEIFNAMDSTAKLLCGGDQYVIGSSGECKDTVFFKVNLPPPVAIDSSKIILSSPSCFGRADGFITIGAKGGRAPYTYSWAHGPMVPGISNLSDGTYLVTIKDSLNCQFTDSLRLRQPDSIRVDIIQGATIDVSCFGKSDGRITTAWTGGNRGRGTFIWSPNAGQDSILTGLSAGTYRLEVVDQKGCRGFTDYTIQSPPEITASYSPIDSIQCSGQQVPFSVLNAQGGGGPNYQWTINSGAPNGIGQFVPLFPGLYSIRIFDKNNCFIDTTILIDQAASTLDVDFIDTEVEIQLGDSTFLNGILNSTSSIDTVIWTPAGGIKNIFSNASYAQPGQTTTYILTVVDVNGCTSSDQITVKVQNSRKFYISNVFSPNDDGINDQVTAFAGAGVKAVKSVQIFDRWGDLVHQDQNLSIGGGYVNIWNGRYGVNGKPLNPAVFVYKIEVEFLDGFIFQYKGDITLIR